MHQETFFAHQNFRWLRLALLLVFILIVLYFLMMPELGAHGGSLYGYSVGVLCAAAIIHLMWFGIRKRSYHSSSSTVKGWLSAHVWLGISLIIAVPLHSGFQMGLNVHGLSYFLMLMVVVSGIWGAVNYKILAPKIDTHRGSGNLKTLIEQIHIYSKNISDLSQERSDDFLSLRNQIEVQFPKSYWKIMSSKNRAPLDKDVMSAAISRLREDEREYGIRLIQHCEKKRELVDLVLREARTGMKLKLWLLFHLPLSLALLVAMFSHIIIVLVYRS